MTTKELNRDIKRLNKSIKDHLSMGIDEFFLWFEDVAKPEYLRLYHADSKFEYMSRSSILIMYRLNLRYRIIALHQWGIEIEL